MSSAACIDAATPGGIRASQNGTTRAAALVPWVCIYTQPQAERWATQNLQRLGYVCWLPMAWVTRRDRVVRSLQHRVQTPLWPRYALIRFDATQSSWSPIRSCPGVVDLVRSGSQVPRIADDAVAATQKALQAEEAFAAMSPLGRPRRHPGEAVRLVAGVLSGHDAVVLSVGVEMCLVAVLMLGQLREVLVQSDALEARAE